MKKLILLLIVCLLIGCTSEKRYHIDEITNPTDTLCYLKSDMSLLNGMVYNEFGDVGMFKNGKRDIFYKEWYENSQLKGEVYYKDGLVDGLHKQWYESGQLKIKVNFKGGLYDGLQKGWYENGGLQYEWNYIMDKKSGLHKEWYENGQLKSEETYDNGILIEYKYY